MDDAVLAPYITDHSMTPALPFQPARPWHSHPRETAAFVLVAATAMLALAGVGEALPFQRGQDDTEVAPPAPPPMEVRDLAPETALAVNTQIPVATGPNPAARPFSMAGASQASRAQALECLASTVYYEAGQESDAGQRAVAQVVLNRVRHPAFPASVCGVVYQGSTRQTGCQFTFTCDGSLSRRPMPGAWDRARKVAQAALAGAVFAPVGTATHYHANYVVPYWASSLAKTDVEGAHLFYRWQGSWGRLSAFAQRYVGSEASAAALRSATLAIARTAPTMVAAATTLDAVEGVEIKAQGQRVTAHFSPKARAAVEAVNHVPYVQRVTASDNLRYALGDAPETSATAATEQKAFGRAPVTVEAAGAN